MRSYAAATCDEAYRQAAQDILDRGRKQESKTQMTKEVLHASFSIDSPRDRLVFARPINPAFGIVEVLWMLAGRRDEAYLHFWNPRMSRWSNEDGNLCGYGYRLREHFGVDQLEGAMRALQATENSRQVVLQIWDPREDLPDPQPRAKDVPCNVTSHLLLRDGRLEWLQVMRSNDLIWGTPYNFIQFTTLQEILAGWLDANVGSYTHISSSLHVYQRHWEHLAEIPSSPAAPAADPVSLGLSWGEWAEIKEDIVSLPQELSREQSGPRIQQVLDDCEHLPTGYRQLALVLGVEALRRSGHYEQAWALLPEAGDYWGESWRRWARSKTPESAPVVKGTEGS